MGETDVTFRHLLRGLPRPILRLAFPRRRIEPLGLLDPSGSDTARRIFALISEWEDKGRVEGRAAEARLLLHKVLAARSFRVSPDVRARIDEADVARREAWHDAAVTARTIDDVFRGG